VIASYCHDRKLDQIIMGTRGAGAVANMLMGSVASKVLHLVDVPVLLVK
jgi:nucleotide-binding universal stress UspA family protein